MGGGAVQRGNSTLEKSAVKNGIMFHRLEAPLRITAGVPDALSHECGSHTGSDIML